MLISKRVSQKKIVLYAALIFFMFSASGYMIYTNFISTGQPEAEVTPAETGESEAIEEAPTVFREAADNQGGAEEKPAVKKTKGIAEAELFEDQKYKNLKEIIPEETNSKIGKPNPFKSYE